VTIDSDQRTAYTLGLLSPEEEARVQAALDTDPQLCAQLRMDSEALLGLVETLPEMDVPAGAEARLMARLSAERAQPKRAHPFQASVPAEPALPAPRSSFPKWLPLATLGLAAALALAFVVRPAPDPLQRYARTPGATTQDLKSSGAPLGQLVRLPDGRAYLYLNRPAERGRIYQMWQIRAGKPVSLGVFEGQGFLLTGMPPGSTVAVSVEPPGGSPQPTAEPILIQSL